MPRHPCPRLPQRALGKRERATPAIGHPSKQVPLFKANRRRGALMDLPRCAGVSIFVPTPSTEGGDDGMKFYDPILWLIGGVLAYALLSHFFG